MLCRDYDYECWDTICIRSIGKHLAEHNSGRKIRSKIDLEYLECSGTWDKLLRYNEVWPNVEPRVISRWKTRGCWTYEEILARWDGSRFDESRATPHS